MKLAKICTGTALRAIRLCGIADPVPTRTCSELHHLRLVEHQVDNLVVEDCSTAEGPSPVIQYAGMPRLAVKLPVDLESEEAEGFDPGGP